MLKSPNNQKRPVCNYEIVRLYRRREFLTGVGTAATVATFGSGATATDPIGVEAVYIWGQSNNLIHEPETVINRVSKVGISKIYLAWGPLKSASEARIETFIQRCHDTGIEVCALLGLTGWEAGPSAQTELSHIAAYNAEYTSFDGVQLDIEPGGDVAPDYGPWFSELYVGLLDSLAELRLPAVEVAIAPWWFDRASAAAKAVRDHKIVDEIVVMSYADVYTSTARGSVKQKLKRSLEGSDKPYYAALEFQDPDHINTLKEESTLYGRPERAAEIISRLDDDPPENGTGAYRGVAFHYYPYLDILF